MDSFALAPNLGNIVRFGLERPEVVSFFQPSNIYGTFTRCQASNPIPRTKKEGLEGSKSKAPALWETHILGET